MLPLKLSTTLCALGVSVSLTSLQAPAWAAENPRMASATRQAPEPNPLIAAALPLVGIPLGIGIGFGVPLAVGGGSQGPLAFACGTSLGVLGAVSGHWYAGDPQRGFTLAALSAPVALGVGFAALGLGAVLNPSAGSFFPLEMAGLGLSAGLAGWFGYTAWDAHRLASERRGQGAIRDDD